MLLLALALAAATPDCRFDRAALLALDENAFDQDLAGGWRSLQLKGCLAEAADLIRDYRDAAPRKSRYLLFWHEGQLRAELEQRAPAIALFRQAYRPPTEDVIGWNHYVDGSIAFLSGDKPGLQAARDTLARLPKPKDWETPKFNGKPIKIAWPFNLNVLDGFLKCFGQPYRAAYGGRCSKPLFGRKAGPPNARPSVGH